LAVCQVLLLTEHQPGLKDGCTDGWPTGTTRSIKLWQPTTK
jgi:hypothetical protein